MAVSTVIKQLSEIIFVDQTALLVLIEASVAPQAVLLIWPLQQQKKHC